MKVKQIVWSSAAAAIPFMLYLVPKANDLTINEAPVILFVSALLAVIVYLDEQ